MFNKKVIKAKRRKAEQPFVGKYSTMTSPNFTKIEAAVEDEGLLSQSSAKILATKRSYMSPLNYTLFLLRSKLILLHMLEILHFFIYLLDNKIIYVSYS